MSRCHAGSVSPRPDRHGPRDRTPRPDRPVPGSAASLPAPFRPLVHFLPAAWAVTAPPRRFGSWRDELGVVAGMVAVSADRHDVALLILEVRETRSCPSYLHVRNPPNTVRRPFPPSTRRTVDRVDGIPRCRHLSIGFVHDLGPGRPPPRLRGQVLVDASVRLVDRLRE